MARAVAILVCNPDILPSLSPGPCNNHWPLTPAQLFVRHRNLFVGQREGRCHTDRQGENKSEYVVPEKYLCQKKAAMDDTRGARMIELDLNRAGVCLLRPQTGHNE